MNNDKTLGIVLAVLGSWAVISFVAMLDFKHRIVALERPAKPAEVTIYERPHQERPRDFVLSGCSLHDVFGQGMQGEFISGTTGLCKITFTPKMASPDGWALSLHNATHNDYIFMQTVSSSTGAEAQGYTNAGDHIVLAGMAY